ncbi:MAG: S8 family serine peptidase, partial [Saprospiraceae bacterium]
MIVRYGQVSILAALLVLRRRKARYKTSWYTSIFKDPIASNSQDDVIRPGGGLLQKMQEMKVAIQLRIALFFLLCGCVALQGQTQKQYYCYSPDGRIDLPVSGQRILVKFSENANQAEKLTLLSTTLNNTITQRQLSHWRGLDVVDLPSETSPAQIDQWLAGLKAQPAIVYAHPFFRINDNTEQTFTTDFMVGLKNKNDLPLLKQMAVSAGVEVVCQYQYDPLLWFLKTTPASVGHALDMANYFAETGQFEYAEADFLIVSQLHGKAEPPAPVPPVTTDPDYQYQWHLENGGTYCFTSATADADIDAEAAWTTTTGIATIKIAVIDDGLDTTTNELTLLGGYNATTNDPLHTMGPYQGHGDNVAKIAAAIANNNVCGAGVAYGCSVVPVKVLDYLNPANYVVACQASWIATGIDWAWQDAGADVLTNSYGGGSPQTIITDAITRATTKGRGGLGAVVLFSVGNSSVSTIEYPASLSSVIAVGASSPCDERKYEYSCDNDASWGSNYGTGLDVMAPGAKIPICNINNCNTPPVPLFSGTSAACPVAAGVTALILSKNPSLTFANVRYYLESTCEKKWNCNYQPNQPGQPNGTWCPEMGYGRINANSALNAVPAPPTTDVGISVIIVPPCTNSSSPVTVTIDNYGSNGASNIPVQYRLKFNSGSFSSWASAGTYSGTIAAFGEDTLSFNISAPNQGDYTIEVRTQLTGDTGSANDGHSRDWTNNSVSSFPYSEDFESNDGNWTAANTWAWGVPSAPFIKNAASGSKAWVTVLNGKYTDSLYCTRLTSPCFDFTNMNNDPILSFKLLYQIQPRLAGQVTDYAWVEVSTDGGTSWSKIGGLNTGTNMYNDPEGWMEVTENGPGTWLSAMHELTGTKGVEHVKVRFVLQTNEGWVLEGIGIDSVEVFDPPASDARILTINSPNSDCSMGLEQVEAVVQNPGASVLTNVPVEYRFRINGGAFNAWASAGNYTGSLPPATADIFPFTVDFSTKGSYVLEVRTQLAGDSNAANDMASRSFNHYTAVSTFPATESFESGAANWFTGGQNLSWELGAPSGPTINSVSDGTNAWVTNLAGDYNWSEISYVQSTCYDFSSLTDPEILFDINYETWSSAGANVEYSTDGGASWNLIGAQGDPNNWYNAGFTDLGTPGWIGNSSGWLTAQHGISSLAGQSEVIFKVNFGSGNTYSNSSFDGFAFDKFIVRDLITTDAGVTAISLPPPYGCSMGAAETVEVTLENFGVNSISNIPVEYRMNINGGGFGSWTNGGTYTGTIGAYSTATHTFTAGFSVPGDYVLEVRTQLPGDQVPANDTSSKTVTNLSLSLNMFPFCESFENGPNGWTSEGTNSSWAWGVPAGTSIDTASEGTKAWVTNLSGNYNNNEVSWLMSPCIDLSAMSFGKVSFDVYYLTESSVDGLKLQYSITGGSTWVTESIQTNGYNTPSISSFAGFDSQEGWSGNSGQWLTAQAYISPLGSSNVLIRFVFASNGSTVNEGVAIDNICIYDLDTNPVSAQAGCKSWKAYGVGGYGGVDILDDGGAFIGSLTPNGNDLGTVTIDVNDMVSVPQAAGGVYYLPRYFNFECSGGADCPGSGNFPQGVISVTLYYEVPELDAYNAAGSTAYGIADLNVTHYDGNPENCTLDDNSSGTYTVVSNNNILSQFINSSTAFYLNFDVGKFSEFGAHGTTAPLSPPPLPLDLLDFTTTATSRQTVVLSWRTAQEVNTDIFEIQHAAGGLHFTSVGTVPAAGEGARSYQFLHLSPADGANYYRLKMVDTDGSFSFS